MNEPSEQLGVGVLILFTVLPVAGLGIGVLAGAGQQVQPDQANVQFEKIGGSLLVTYSGQYEHIAGNLQLRGPQGNVTWAELSNGTAPGDPISDGTRVQMSQSTAYGYDVGEGETVEAVYVEDGQEYVLGRYGESGVGDEIDLPDGPAG